MRYEISGVVKWINNSLAAELPSHRVRMKVVPSGAGVEIEDIPANALATAAHDSSELPTKPRPLMQWVGIEAPSLDVTV